ncbi:hypothetical protein [Hydrogenovibrio thermophilus]|jgi:hypothetical protein|nr:hypothetical protein [Hydrogenovibrio thermophilus]
MTATVYGGIPMRTTFIGLILSLFVFSLIACTSHSNPGPLAGTWQLTGHADMVITFRDSETEANGIVEKVRYEVRDKTVLVTYLEGIAKGMTMHYTLTGPDTAVTNLGTLRRISPDAPPPS